jgi:predicted phosphoribosyltransferase
MRGPYADRREAGRVLAEKLSDLRGRKDLVVLALPRGGVPVAAEVARALAAPLDVYMVRKLGVPGHEEYAFGAVASDGTVVTNPDVVDGLGIPAWMVERVVATERAVLEDRETRYRGHRAAADVTGKHVVLVDDGLATGSTIRARRSDRPRSRSPCRSGPRARAGTSRRSAWTWSARGRRSRSTR